MDRKEKVLTFLTESCRLLIGLVFIISGFAKAVDPMGGSIKISDYLEAFGWLVLQPFAVVTAFNLAVLEFTLGICMLLGVYRRYASFLVLLFMLFMTPLTLYLALFDPVSDCGCFGDALVISNWQSFGKNVLLLAASIVTFRFNQRMFPCFTFRSYWFVALFTYLAGLLFAYYNYNHLPLIDFRPYKLGVNISEAMTIPDGAPVDEYAYTFVYEKNGVLHTFSLEDCPAEDSTWTFVSSKTELISEGYHPAIEGFQIYDAEGADVTEALLSHDGATLCLIAPKLEHADDEKIDQINELYDYALDHALPFYCITGSSSEAVEEWVDNTGAEYPFLMADDVLLKTMIRSNPGLILLDKGTIRGKWHYNDFPAEGDVEAVITKQMQADVTKLKEDRLLWLNLLTFAVPLSLIWIYDFSRFRRRRQKNQID